MEGKQGVPSMLCARQPRKRVKEKRAKAFLRDERGVPFGASASRSCRKASGRPDAGGIPAHLDETRGLDNSRGF